MRDRIRKVKCDEQKPHCSKCVSTGRTCDGYESSFVLYRGPASHDRLKDGSKASITAQASPHSLDNVKIPSEDVELLNRYLSTKTMFAVELGCSDEARQMLEASLTDPPVKHALSSLRALRYELETTGTGVLPTDQTTPSYNYGLQQYGMALVGLASDLCSLSPNSLKSALLCCQIFISIEQAQGNYVAMAQHIVRGLRIMREYRARPMLLHGDLVWAHAAQLPLLDVYLIKFFAAPCRFSDPSAGAASGAPSYACPVVAAGTDGDGLEHVHGLRTIAPDLRRELTTVAERCITWLQQVSQLTMQDDASRLQPAKVALLHSLDVWVERIDRVEVEGDGPEALSVSFSRLLHLILRIVLLGALECEGDARGLLVRENERLLQVAAGLEGRVRAFSSEGERFKTR